MDPEIDANTPLDYIEFRIFPSQNRYEACTCCANKIEKVTSGVLEHLLLHSPEVKDLHSKGSNAKYKLQSPENNDVKWFTKSVLIRFLHLIGSEKLPSITSSVKNEISQLEDVHKFHFSLYAKAEGSDASKSELLKAMDLRLTALRGELIAAFDQAACSAYSVEEITDIKDFSHHFGSIDLRDSLCKYLELQQENLAVHNSTSKPLAANDNQTPEKNQEHNHTPKLLPSETPIIYGVSPAKAAQVERQISTESDESSFSSDDEERTLTDRSRSLVRPTSPRRSSSPMRRVQIGRSGPRRSTSIAIKSLNYFPAREEVVSQQPPRKSENNVRQMSVQDAISLFESKQKNRTVDDDQTAANKTLLRRWSSGVGENSFHYPQANNNNNNIEIMEIKNSSPEAELIIPSEDISPIVESTNASEKLSASAECCQQKDAELNELLSKMMETKPGKNRAAAINNSRKRQSLPTERKFAFHDQYKEKQDWKLCGEKNPEKEKQLRATQKAPDVVRKSRPGFSTASDTGNKNIVKKFPKTEESPKLGIIKKVIAPKSSSLPTTRKSGPSLPSPKISEKPTAKIKTPVQKNPPVKRSQPTPPISRLTPKIETSQPRAKSVKSNPNGTKSSPRSGPEQKQQPATKPSKTAKLDLTISSAKPSLYNKVTRKGSVVPIESKPFLRKGSGGNNLSTVSPAKKVVKKNLSSSRHPTIRAEANKAVSSSSDSVVVVQLEEREIGDSEIHTSGSPQVDPTVDPAVELEEELRILPATWVEIEEHEDEPVVSPVEVLLSNGCVRHSLSQMLLEENSEHDDAIEWGSAENNAHPVVYQRHEPKGLKRLLKFARKRF